MASIAVLVVCGMDERGQWDLLTIESAPEESKGAYLLLFGSLHNGMALAVRRR